MNFVPFNISEPLVSIWQDSCIRKPKIVILLLLGFIDIVDALSQPLLWNVEKLMSLKMQTNGNLYRSIIKEADRLINTPVPLITNKKCTYSGDKHNYESLSIYYWPDSINPNRYVYRDGIYNPEYKELDYPKLLELRRRLKFCSIAYYLTENQSYADDFVLCVDRWFMDSATYMYPHFEYAQFIPGVNNNKGNGHGIIDAYVFLDIIESIRLMDMCNVMNNETKKALLSWFGEFASWLRTSSAGKKEREIRNNHSIAYFVTLYNICHLIHDEQNCKQIREDFREMLEYQIAADGSMPEELKRTKAFDYSIYNLTHILDFCILAETPNSSFYWENSAIINRAVEFLLIFVGNKELFKYTEYGDWTICEEKLLVEIRRFQRLKSYRFVEYYSNNVRMCEIDKLLK